MATADYDKVKKVSANPTQLYDIAKGVKTENDTIQTSLSNIQNAAANLPFNWTGGPAETYQDFFDKLAKVWTTLFATEAAANDNKLTVDDGVLNVIRGAIESAAKNYSDMEGGAAHVFSEFTKPGTGGDPLKKPDNRTDIEVTAITETWA